MSSVRAIEAEVSIKSGVQAECTVGREVVVEVHEDVNLESLTATANGSYTPTEGVDGFSDVTVNVPERIPVTESLSVTENGTYEPTEGIDGYNRVTVSVPPIIPDIEPLTVTANGVYTAVGDGFNPVTVNVEVPRDPNVVEGEFIGTETGVLTIDIGYEGNGFPKFAMIQPVSGISDSEFLSSPYKFINAINTHIMSKSTGATPTYQGGGGVNSARQMSTYVRYQTSYDITATSGSPYSQEPPSTAAATCLRFSDNKTMKIYVESVDEETHHVVFAAGIKYKYQVIY